MTGAVGFVTDTGVLICRPCATNTLLSEHRLGQIVGPILHPAPNGMNLHQKESEHYDAPCGLCGWAIRSGRDTE
jgi:hypothetical protein